jgi:hypothetical protein
VVVIASIPVPDRQVLELAALLRQADFVATAERLEDCYDREVKVVGLSIVEREQLLRALEDGPSLFAELRGVLLQEHVWRVREGLV